MMETALLQERAQALGYNFEFINIYGPILIGNMLSCFLLGVYLVGAVYYFNTQRKDVWYNKAIVGCILVSTILDTCFSASRTVKVCAVHPGNLVYFLDLKARPEDWATTVCANFTAVACQSFFVFRIIRFSRAMRFTYTRQKQILGWVFYIVLGLGLLLCWAAAFGGPAFLSLQDSYAAVISHDKTTNPTYGWLTILTDMQIGCFLAMDILITIGMTYELRSARTGFKQTNTVLDTILTVILRNGLLLLCFQIIQLVTFHETTTAWTEFFPNFYGKIYGITVLSLLLQPKWAQQAYIEKMDREAATHPHHSETTVSRALPAIGMTSGQDTRSGMLGVTESGVRCRSCGSATFAAEGESFSKAGRLTVSFQPLKSGESTGEILLSPSAESEKGAAATTLALTPQLAYLQEEVLEEYPAPLHVVEAGAIEELQEENPRRGSRATDNSEISITKMLGPGIRYII